MYFQLPLWYCTSAPSTSAGEHFLGKISSSRRTRSAHVSSCWQGNTWLVPLSSRDLQHYFFNLTLPAWSLGKRITVASNLVPLIGIRKWDVTEMHRQWETIFIIPSTVCIAKAHYHPPAAFIFISFYLLRGCQIGNFNSSNINSNSKKRTPSWKVGHVERRACIRSERWKWLRYGIGQELLTSLAEGSWILIGQILLSEIVCLLKMDK